MNQFITNPHLPDGEVKVLLCDGNLKNDEILETNYTIVQSYCHNNILSGIHTHPDMTFCPLENELAVVAKGSYEYYSKLLAPYGFKLIEGKNELKGEYPFDIALNCVLLNRTLFHYLKYTDKAILEFAQSHDYKLVNVKQGYTKCSTLIVDEKSVITTDIGLNKIYNENGINSIAISNDNIRINGFEKGFIGGAGGKLSKDKIAFFGDYRTHKDFNKINDFLKSRNISTVCFSKDDLFDYGSLIPLVHK